MSKLRDVLTLLMPAEPLPQRLKDHPLTGEWRGYRNLHIEPDWLLLYKIDGDDLILARTGRHADLFRQLHEKIQPFGDSLACRRFGVLGRVG